MKNYLLASALLLVSLSPSLAGAASAPFQHYGYFYADYSAPNNDLTELKTYTKTAFAGSIDQAKLLVAKGFQDIVYANFFGTGFGTLTTNDPDYETKALTIYKNSLISLKNDLLANNLLNKIATFYIEDEPALHRNVIPNQNFLNNVEATFKQIFPDKRSLMVFAEDPTSTDQSRGAHFNPPPNLDIIAVDPYFWDNTSVGCSSSEISNYLYATNKYSKINWALQFNKPIWVAGDAMLRNGADPLPCYVTNTFNILKNDNRIQGLIWFIYDKSFVEGTLKGAANSASLVQEIKDLTPPSPPPPLPSLSNVKVYVASTNTASTQWVQNGSVRLDQDAYVKVTGLDRSQTPKGCTVRAGSSGCNSAPTNYRDFMDSEWSAGNGTSELVTYLPANFFTASQTGAYDVHGYYPATATRSAVGPAIVGMFTILPSSSSPPPPPPPPAQPSVLTSSQINSILQFLQSFTSDQLVINNVRNALSGRANINQPSNSGAVSSNRATSGATPNITLIFPTVINAEKPVDITGYGSNINPGFQIVYSGSSSGSFQPDYISQSKFKFSSAQFPVGSYYFYVKNPDGKTSGGLALTILGPTTIGGTGGAIPPGPFCGGAIVTPASPSANYSSCNLPGGSTLPAGQSTASNLWWKISGTCYSAPFSCSDANGLIPGSQFSPMPPQPASGDMIYASQSACNSGSGGVPKGNGNSSGSGGSGTQVNGTCGTSACAYFNSPPTTNLCSSGTASTATGSGPFTWLCNGSGGGSTVRCAAGKTAGSGPPPPPAPPPAPAPSGCGTEDKFMQAMYVQTLYPIPPINVPAGAGGYSIKFVANKNETTPNGVLFKLLNEAGSPKSVQTVISACAHSFTPVGGQAACSTTGPTSALGLLYLPATGPANPTASDCLVQTGGTYYINFRPVDQSTPVYGPQISAWGR